MASCVSLHYLKELGAHFLNAWVVTCLPRPELAATNFRSFCVTYTYEVQNPRVTKAARKGKQPAV
jgi:hypothetical protein